MSLHTPHGRLIGGKFYLLPLQKKNPTEVGCVSQPADSDTEDEGGYVQELVDPDLLDHLVACLEGIDHHVTQADEGEALHRDCVRHGVYEDHQGKGGRVGQAVVEHDFPALPLFHDHPGALEREVPDEVQGRVDQKTCRQVEDHDASFRLPLAGLPQLPQYWALDSSSVPQEQAGTSFQLLSTGVLQWPQ